MAVVVIQLMRPCWCSRPMRRSCLTLAATEAAAMLAAAMVRTFSPVKATPRTRVVVLENSLMAAICSGVWSGVSSCVSGARRVGVIWCLCGPHGLLSTTLAAARARRCKTFVTSAPGRIWYGTEMMTKVVRAGAGWGLAGCGSGWLGADDGDRSAELEDAGDGAGESAEAELAADVDGGVSRWAVCGGGECGVRDV